MSCWSVGNCIAVGGYYDANGFQNMTATRTNGVWAPAVKSDVPSDAGTPNPDAGFSAVSCVTGGSCTAVGDYGNTSGYYNAQAADVLNDATPPKITHTVTPNAPDGSAGWYRGTPSVTFDVTDPESPATPEGTSCKARIIDTDGADQSFTCTATSLGGTTSDTVTINRDSTAPTVSFDNGGIADGGSYVWGSTPAAPTCSASDATSGVDGTCTVTGYDTTVGPQKLAATATDKAGNTTTITRSYTVTPWTTSGFFAPVDMGGVLNTVKGGATVPVKFKVTAGSTPVTDPATVGAFSATKVTCATGLPTDAIETTTTTGGTTLRYDATAGQFIYNWQTPKTTAGTCYKLTLTTPDSTPTSALFQLK
ncbi:PxKF domain-containing protein [Nocardioides korecus]